jgi:polysaccharide chain length determinant protein (PEP-CTERM system associated)
MLPGRKYTPEDIAAIAWRRKWIVASVVAVVTTAAIAMSLRLPDLYRSETLILVVPQRVPESYVRSTVTMRIEDRLRSLRQQILSRSNLERIMDDFQLFREEIGDQQPVELIVEKMRQRVQVDTVREDTFRVGYVDTSPRIAMIVADRLAAMFIEENLRDRGLLADGTNEFLESQLAAARKRLETHEQKLEAYRRKNSGELPSQLQSNLQVIESTQNLIQNLNESINRDRDRRIVLERSQADADSSMPLEPGAVRSSTADTPEVRAIDQLETARGDLRQLLLRLKPEHPDVVAKARTIKELENKVHATASAGDGPAGRSEVPLSGADLVRRARSRQIQQDLAKLDEQIANKEKDMRDLRQRMSDYQLRVDAVPGHESELTGLMRDYDTLQKVYADLLAKKENSQISANLERQQVGEQFKVIDPARLPEEPFSPHRGRIALLAAAMGLFLAVVVLGIIEYRDQTLRTEDEMVRTLILPVIAAIPLMTAIADARRRQRNRIVTGAVTAMTLVGLTVAVWKLVQ